MSGIGRKEELEYTMDLGDVAGEVEETIDKATEGREEVAFAYLQGGAVSRVLKKRLERAAGRTNGKGGVVREVNL